MNLDNTTYPTDLPVSDWIEAESVKLIKNSVIRTTISSFVGMVVLLLMLYPFTSNFLIWFFCVLHLCVFSARFIYFSRSNKNITLNKYYNIIVISAGFVWGATVYLLFNEDQSRLEAIALCVIIIYGMLATINLSHHLRSVQLFLAGYGLGIVGSLLANIGFHSIEIVSTLDIMSLIVASLFLFILYKFGKRLNESNDHTLELQYKNNLLIESLKFEKQVALEAVELKNRFMASAAHDMRQPILALDIYTDMVNIDPEALPKLVPKISQATKSVITMFDAMFDLARISLNQLTPDRVWFNFKDTIAALEQQYLAVANEKGLQLRVQYKNTNLEIYDDPILLRRILSNLLSNAVKYTESGGILLVCRGCIKHGFRVEVWDTGVGISPLMQKAVFSEFYKNPENSGTSEGFGLGLSIVSQLCALLGHKLTMKSRRGHGTVVSIRLSDSVSNTSPRMVS